jgi:hypothetical protein
MKKSSILIVSTLLFSSSLMITGCTSSGGGGSSGSGGITYSGPTTPAAINSTSAEPLATTAGEAVKNAGTSSTLPTFASIGSAEPGPVAQDILNIFKNSQTLNLPAGYTINGSCGGSLTIPDSAYNTTSGPVTTTMTFSNFCDAASFSTSGYTMNGSVDIHIDDVASFTSFTMTFKNFTVKDSNGNVIETFNATVTCDTTSCHVTSDFTGSDGKVHRVGDVSMTGDETSGFNGAMTLYHDTYGVVSVTVTNVTYGSCGNFPDGGSIDIASTNGSSASITFNSDCTYSGTYDTGTSSGTFSGTFK